MDLALRARRRRRWNRPGRIATLVAAPPLAAMATFLVVGLVSHDHGQSVNPLAFQAQRAAASLRDWASEHGGVLPDPGPEVDALLAAARVTERVSCVGPLRYERVDEGRRARPYALGEDGRPGGEGRDRDLEWWVEAEARGDG